MKKITSAIFTIFFLISCSKETGFVTISGNITNLQKTDSLITFKNNAFSKSIKIDNEGKFKDTLTVPKGDYFSILINNKNSGFVFLRNGYDLTLDTDNNAFIDKMIVSGNGASSSNFLLAQFKFGKKLGNPRALFALDKTAFDKKIKEIRYGFDSLQSGFKNLDTMLVRTNKQQNDEFLNFLSQNYEKESKRIITAEKAKANIAKGKPSPKFFNYINSKGRKSSLDDYKGKYVYIDVWATWCTPCIAEIPSLKKLEKLYHKKNIKFVSISIDNERTAGTWDKAKIKWQKMVANKNLTGEQLFAGKDIEFLNNYLISMIPRFILIDPKGTIVSATAPRPSSPDLIKLFDEIGL